MEDYGEERVIFLDLRDAVCFVREQTGEEGGGKTITHMRMPQDWADSFGMPYVDYAQRQDIKTFDEVAVFDMKMGVKGRNVERLTGES